MNNECKSPDWEGGLEVGKHQYDKDGACVVCGEPKAEPPCEHPMNRRKALSPVDRSEECLVCGKRFSDEQIKLLQGQIMSQLGEPMKTYNPDCDEFQDASQSELDKLDCPKAEPPDHIEQVLVKVKPEPPEPPELPDDLVAHCIAKNDEALREYQSKAEPICPTCGLKLGGAWLPQCRCPKAEGDGLEDAAIDFIPEEDAVKFGYETKRVVDLMASFARQQRREAVAEYIHRLKDRRGYVTRIESEQMAMVAKEME